STRSTSTLSTLGTFSTSSVSALSTVGESLLSEPHEDVLGEPPHERRVIPDPLDAEPGLRGDAAQLGDVGERIEVIRLAQVFLAPVDQPHALEPLGQP